jgi:DNA-binding NarL/FixJ family response regulator
MTRLLIADDHDVVRSGVRSIMESVPRFEIVGEASDGKAAVEQALLLHPDVVILDYALPLMNGVEATRQICNRVPGAEVLIFTMHDTATLVREILEAGAKGFLLKSDARRFLVAAVESLADHKPFFTSKVSEELLTNYLAMSPANRSELSARERSVVQLIGEGHPNREIAEVLSISLKTVEAHRASAMRKLNVSSTAALIRYAMKNGIIAL